MIDALRLTTPDVGAVARSMLGVLAMAAVALASASPSAAVWAAGAAAIAGAIAMQDSPAGRVPLVIVVSLQMGAVVFLGALTASYNVVFLCRRRGVVLCGGHAVGAGQQTGPGRGRLPRRCWWSRRRLRPR